MYIVHVCILPFERKKDKENLEYVIFRKEKFFKIQKIQLLIYYSVNNYSRNNKTYVDNKLLYV